VTGTFKSYGYKDIGRHQDGQSKSRKLTIFHRAPTEGERKSLLTQHSSQRLKLKRHNLFKQSQGTITQHLSRHIFRWAVSILVGLVLEVYAVVCGKTFDLQVYEINVRALLAGAGGGGTRQLTVS
jgi:hypothetical protein